MPVRVFADGANRADRKAQLAKVVADIAPRVQHLDIAMARERRRRQCRGQAGARPRSLPHHRQLLRQRTRQAKSAPRSIRNACPAFARTRSSRSSIPTSSSPSTTATSSSSTAPMRNCCSRSGPINDTSSVPWTMFNDNVSMGFFDVYDQYILNLLYDPRIKAGMTVQEVKAVLPRGAGGRAGLGDEGERSAGVRRREHRCVERVMSGSTCERMRTQSDWIADAQLLSHVWCRRTIVGMTTPTTADHQLRLQIAFSDPIPPRQQRRAARRPVLVAHARQAVLGQRMVGQDRQALVALLAGDAKQQFAHRLGRPAEPVHHVDAKCIGVLLGLARIGCGRPASARQRSARRSR